MDLKRLNDFQIIKQRTEHRIAQYTCVTLNAVSEMDFMVEC